MTTNIPGIATMSSRDLRAILKAKVTAEKAAEKAEHDALLRAFAGVAQPLFDRVVETVEQTDKDDSTWAGRSVRGIPFEVEGHKFTMSITVTDVDRTEQKKVELEAAAQQFLLEQAQASAQTEG